MKTFHLFAMWTKFYILKYRINNFNQTSNLYASKNFVILMVFTVCVVFVADSALI